LRAVAKHGGVEMTEQGQNQQQKTSWWSKQPRNRKYAIVAIAVVVLAVIGIVSGTGKDTTSTVTTVAATPTTAAAAPTTTTGSVDSANPTKTAWDEAKAVAALNSAEYGHGIVVHSNAGDFILDKVFPDADTDGKSFRTRVSENDDLPALWDTASLAIQRLVQGLEGMTITGFSTF
jgi:hypothetical protein